jgi:parallel beta-helix repeat protein
MVNAMTTTNLRPRFRPAARPRTTARRRAHLAAAAVAPVALISTAGVAAATTDAGSPPCGAVVTANVRLTSDLVDCPGPGLVIGASGITIDLGGHVLDGVGEGAGIDGNGGHDRVSITNGTISGFGRGVELLDNDGSRISALVLDSNGLGIAAGRTDRLLVEGVTATDNTFAGFELTFGDDARVRRSTVSGSDFGGVIDRFSSGSRYERNVISANAFFGITLSSATGAHVVDNIVRDNEFDGIQLGFRATGNRVTGNQVTDNGGIGITVEEAGNVVVRNTVSGNLGGDCIGTTCG